MGIYLNQLMQKEELSEAVVLQPCPVCSLSLSLSGRDRTQESVGFLRIRSQKLALFADDIVIFLTDPTQSLPKLMKMLDEYGSYSG